MTMVPDTWKSNFGNQKLLRFHIWFNMTLHYKMRQKLLQNATAILLQNTVNVYYKMRQAYYIMRQFYYKMRQSLPNATFITKCVGTSMREISDLVTLGCSFNSRSIFDFSLRETIHKQEQI